MRFVEHKGRLLAFLAAAGLGLVGLTGCGTPGAPQPPSLKLPEQVNDLAALRAGSTVALQWTMPRKTTDHLPLKGPIPVSVCWRKAAEPCQPIDQTHKAPEEKAQFQLTLPPALLTGEPRPISLFVELKSPKGRSAGLSNPAIILAGTAPGPVAGLTAEVRADGVALHWAAAEATLVRLHRTLITPAEKPAAKAPAKSESDPSKAAAEPPLRDLLVESPTGVQSPGANPPSNQGSNQGSEQGAKQGAKQGAMDRTARFGEVYEYTAQRLIQRQINGATLELAGAASAPVRVATVDTFPPAIPQGLAAVYVSENKTIDLSWDPDTEPDLAGYIVYRADPSGDWQRISGPKPLPGAAYRDPSPAPGHSYRYAVTAIDQLGHESARSPEATESVPNPEEK